MNDELMDEAYDALNAAFEQYWKDKDVEQVFETINTYRVGLTRYWKYKSDMEKDYRTGAESYGFGNIKGNLSYISDRWQCAFRIKWLLDVSAMKKTTRLALFGEQNGQNN